MEQKKPSELTDQELLQEAKKIKSKEITSAVFIGLISGIAIYSIVKNGLGFLPLILMVAVFVIIQNGKKYRAGKADLEAEIKLRHLNTTKAK